MPYYAPTNSIPRSSDTAPSCRMKSIIDSMQSNVAGRAVHSKLFTVTLKDGSQSVALQIILSSYERDMRLARDVENHLKAEFNKTVQKAVDSYESIYGEPISLNLENEQVANDALGYGYVNTAQGAFMANADNYIRSYMVRVVRNYLIEE